MTAAFLLLPFHLLALLVWLPTRALLRIAGADGDILARITEALTG